MTRANNKKRRTRKKNKGKFNKDYFSLTMIGISIVLFILILSDKTGIIGKWVSGFFTKAFGRPGIVFPLLLLVSFIYSYRDKYRENLRVFTLLEILYLLVLALFSRNYLAGDLTRTLEIVAGNLTASGGYVGGFFAYYLGSFFGIVGLWTLFIICLTGLLIEFSPYGYGDFFRACGRGIKKLSLSLWNGIKKFGNFTKAKIEARREGEDETSPLEEETQILPTKSVKAKKNAEEGPSREDDFEVVDYTKSDQLDFTDLDPSYERNFSDYKFPSLDLLEDRVDTKKLNKNDFKANAALIEETLASFGISGKIVQINVGPTVTLYELQPQKGVKVSRIVSLSDDLALALASDGIRIEAPIPGKSHVGIEVPNREKSVVGFKEVITSKDFNESKYEIPFALGKSIDGQAIISGVEKMPHLLVSGATGSGKSVCINTIIMSIIYKHTPEEVKLLLIDPKMVELSVYNGIPHLIMPVITDPKKASSSLFWAISEMERRYKLFEDYKVRDIKSYRKKKAQEGDMEDLAYIVIIIDELSDLMMTAASEVEDYITRLAQKSRACGIHLIIATQRPTVDVITGNIKANIPSRIAFAVSSQIDSRTILDTAGAEKLLGKGDMLFLPTGAMKPMRIQGAFVSDDEVSRTVEAIKLSNESDYNQSAIDKVDEKVSSLENPSEDEDELINEAIEIVINEKTASVSLLQRKLKIGYARAGRLIDQLEERGIVGSYRGSKPREVLVDKSFLEGE